MSAAEANEFSVCQFFRDGTYEYVRRIERRFNVELEALRDNGLLPTKQANRAINAVSDALFDRAA